MQGMKVVCEIDMTNAAFEDPEELIRIKEQKNKCQFYQNAYVT